MPTKRRVERRVAVQEPAPAPAPAPEPPPEEIPTPATVKIIIDQKKHAPVPVVQAATDPVRTRQISRATEMLSKIYEEEPEIRDVLEPSVKGLLDLISAYALEVGGYRKYDPEHPAVTAYEVYRARSIFTTGEEPERGARCVAVTKMGTRCRNRPMIGAEHCSVTGHATRDELEKVRQNAAAWGRHFSELVDKIGLTNEFSSLKSVINR